MCQEDRVPADLDRVERGPVARVGAVDGHADLVHPAHRAPAELRQPTVADLLEARAERVRLAVGDAQDAQADPVQDLDPVELVLDHRRALLRGDERDLALPVGAVEVLDGFAPDQEVLVGEVAQAHAHVVDDVVPLPAALRRDEGGAVLEVVEHAVPVRIREPRTPSRCGLPCRSLPSPRGPRGRDGDARAARSSRGARPAPRRAVPGRRRAAGGRARTGSGPRSARTRGSRGSRAGSPRTRSPSSACSHPRPASPVRRVGGRSGIGPLADPGGRASRRS